MMKRYRSLSIRPASLDVLSLVSPCDVVPASSCGALRRRWLISVEGRVTDRR